MTTEQHVDCAEVEEALTEILEGTAPPRLYDHIAECDQCRDLRHEASLAAERVGFSGADFRPAEGFVDQLVGRLLEARPEGAASHRSSTSPVVESGPVVVREERAPAPAGLETAATVFDPLAAAKAEGDAGPTLEARTEVSISSFRGGPRPISPTREPGAEPAPSVGPTLPPDSAPSPSGVAAITQHGPVTTPASDVVAALDADRSTHSKTVERSITPDPATRSIEPPLPRRAEKVTAPRSFGRRASFLAAGAVAMAAAVAGGLYLKGRTTNGPAPSDAITAAPWTGSVASVSRASADKSGGLESCTASGACAPLADGATVAAGSILRTDARTRAHVKLADGTAIALDRASELELSKGADRTARVKRGTIVADVTHIEGSAAHFAFPRGDVEVVGTKLAITASDDRASIEVARGLVKVSTDRGKSVDVRAGEEATLVGNAEPVVASSGSLADTMEWSDQRPEDVEGPTLRGLGELRARKPGQTKEKDHAVRLAKHGVKVRIVDVVARTEVDETFTNDTDEELEGIFRFPLPPGAQIEKLALEVDGKLVEGAFVDRDKGAAIWRGVIQNAAPKSPKPKEEIIWVPGPWRDPALLEWQRGGRFELKIFPIPKRGSRRVQLTYTQTVEQSGGLRRFTYPLAHDPSGTTKVDSFDLDLQVLGLDKSVGVSSRGYELTNDGGGSDGDRRTMHATSFVPAGDLTVEYALPDRDKEVTAWAYSAPPSAAAVLPAPLPTRAKTADERAAADTANAILDDRSPYVAISVRPKLPRWHEAKERVHAIVVDSSRSMFGERFARATRLAASLVREMDRRDSFVLLACDTVCKPMAAEAGGSPRPQAPGAPAAGDVERFLGGVEPDGGSDLSAAVSAARSAVGAHAGKELRILYLGDGTPSVGPTRPAHIEAAVRGSLPAGDGSVVAVALGADADTTSLEAMARGGGGVVVPYVPGQKVSSAALDVLSAAYGVVLRDPEVELPAGLTQVTPSRLDPIRAGGETMIVARMTGGSKVSGQVRVRGRVAGDRFEQSYPLEVVSTESAGNAFVPRLYAAAKIAELERLGGEAQKPTVIELSRRFAVASRFTSLLVLESEAMFKAFGLERSATGSSFTGEQRADSSSGESEARPDEADADRAKDEGRASAAAGPAAAPTAAGALAAGDKTISGFGVGGGGRAGGGQAPGRPAKKAAEEPLSANAYGDDAPVTREEKVHPKGKLAHSRQPADPFFDAPAPVAPPPDFKPAPRPAPAGCAPGDLMCAMSMGDRQESSRRARARPLVPMRRVFDRKVSFDPRNSFVAENLSKLTAAERSLLATPDSRDKTIELFALYSTSGRIGEAQELTAKWSGRDALDPDALMARADLAARQGDRERAVRILGGLADVRPADRAIQTRLADLQDAAGKPALACEHRIALADLAPSEPKLVAAAIACSRTQGQLDLASVLREDAGEKVRDAVDRLLLAAPPAAPPMLGDVQVSATWSGGVDLDLALVDAQGKRTSWLGSPSKATVTSRDADSLGAESLAISALPQGSYVVEVTRAAGKDSSDSIHGEVTLRLGGEVRKVPFTLSGPRAEVGTVRVSFSSHLEPVTEGSAVSPIGPRRWNDF